MTTTTDQAPQKNNQPNNKVPNSTTSQAVPGATNNLGHELELAISHLSESQTVINEQMFIKVLTTSKLLVPVNISGEIKKDDQGRMILSAHNEVNYILLQNDTNENYCPVFTSEAELNKFGNSKSGHVAQDFYKIATTILKAKEVAGIVINPFGLSMTLNQEMLASITNAQAKNPNGREYTIKTGSKVAIGEPAVTPTAMIAALKNEFSQHDCVNSATLRLMIRPEAEPGNNMSYLVIVDCGDPEPTHLFEGAAVVAKPHADNIPLDFIKFKPESEFCVNALKNSKPFYKKHRGLMNFFGKK